MKQTLTLGRGARLLRREGHGDLTPAEIRRFAEDPAGWTADLPAQVADILLAHGDIEDPRHLDGARQAAWIAETDWVYRLSFPHPRHPGPVWLEAEGLDTLADVYLNGTRLAAHRDFYLPLRVAVGPHLAEENTLLLHFHSVPAWLAGQELPAAWAGRVHRNRLLRKPHEDFNSFHGAFPCFTPVGVYAPLSLVLVDEVELRDVHVAPRLVDHSDRATVHLAIEADGEGQLAVALLAPDRSTVTSATADTRDGRASFDLEVPSAQRWWPRGYGGQPLYTAVVHLLRDGRRRDTAAKQLGFRTVAMGGDFDLRVNDRPVKLWGCNFVPPEQFTHVWPLDRLEALLDLAENAHLVSLRLWGPGLPYPTRLYEEADRRGLLLWSEFPHTWGLYPDHADFLQLCRREAEEHVRRLRHHPSIFLWCGGNEVRMGTEMTYGSNAPFPGRDLLHRLYPEVCASLDPDRYYHPDSPAGGTFANDPDQGDSHGYTHFWHVRGSDYPVLLSEHARWSPPQLKTLRRFIPDPAALWPAGFVSRIRHRRPPGPAASGVAGNDAALDDRDLHEGGFLPKAWQMLGKGGTILNGRAGPIGSFYDTGDTPEGLIYRLGSAHSLFLRRELERFRRGQPAHLAHLPRRTKGHYWWRLNGTWPLIDSELVDYLGEPKMAYYSLRRAFAPVLLSFDLGDRIALWLTNDSGRAVQGTVRFALRDLHGGPPRAIREEPVLLEHDQSRLLFTLDFCGMIPRNLALTAHLVGPDGQVLAETSDFADEERNLLFPEPRLHLARLSADTVEVGTDAFARCVALTAWDGPQEAFGWVFEDNFFDLPPGASRRIRIIRQGPGDRLLAASFYGPAPVCAGPPAPPKS